MSSIVIRILGIDRVDSDTNMEELKTEELSSKTLSDCLSSIAVGDDSRMWSDACELSIVDAEDHELVR